MDSTTNTGPQYLIASATGTVTIDRATLDMWIAAKGWKVIGYKTRIGLPLREEIEAQPIVSGLSGPFYGGPGLCRYEVK